MLVSVKQSFPNNSALAEGTRVKVSAGFLAAASDVEDEVGTIEQRVLATDPVATVLPIDHPGVRHMIAAASFAQWAQLYAAAGGKVDDSGTLARGVALEAASGNGSVVKVFTLRASTAGVIPLEVPQIATVATGGNTISNANAVDYGFTRVTGADNAAKAVRLPAAAAGKVCVLKSATSGATLAVFPSVGDAINGAAANAVYNMANLSQRVFVAYDDTTWYSDEQTPT